MFRTPRAEFSQKKPTCRPLRPPCTSILRTMHFPGRLAKLSTLLTAFGIATYLALELHGGGLWQGLTPASAANATQTRSAGAYDLTQLKVVNEVLKTVRDRYVDPKRVKPRDMLLSALNYVQRDVAQVIVLHEEGSPTVKVKVDTQEKEFHVDNVLGPWDVSARLRDVFAFVQDGLRGTDVDLREVEYAACNGMLHTLDPHSVLLSPEAYKGDESVDERPVRRPRHRHLDSRSAAHGDQPDAEHAGIARGGQAKVRPDSRKINNESTLNMVGLNEAVQHLRGAPNSGVKVFIHRDGPGRVAGSLEDVRAYARRRSTSRSVEHRMLEGNVAATSGSSSFRPTRSS